MFHIFYYGRLNIDNLLFQYFIIQMIIIIVFTDIFSNVHFLFDYYIIGKFVIM